VYYEQVKHFNKLKSLLEFELSSSQNPLGPSPFIVWFIPQQTSRPFGQSPLKYLNPLLEHMNAENHKVPLTPKIR
jgi:hypothetical protein